MLKRSIHQRLLNCRAPFYFLFVSIVSSSCACQSREKNVSPALDEQRDSFSTNVQKIDDVSFLNRIKFEPLRDWLSKTIRNQPLHAASYRGDSSRLKNQFEPIWEQNAWSNFLSYEPIYDPCLSTAFLVRTQSDDFVILFTLNENVPHATPGPVDHHILLVNSNGMVLSLVEVSTSTRMGDWQCGHIEIECTDSKASEFSIRFVHRGDAKAWPSLDHEIRLEFQHYNFPWDIDEYRGDRPRPDFEKNGLCKLTIKDEKLVVIFPNLELHQNEKADGTPDPSFHPNFDIQKTGSDPFLKD